MLIDTLIKKNDEIGNPVSKSLLYKIVDDIRDKNLEFERLSDYILYGVLPKGLLSEEFWKFFYDILVKVEAQGGVKNIKEEA